MSPPRLAIFGSLTTDNVLTARGVALPRSYAGNVVYAALGARLWGTEIGIVSRGARFQPRVLGPDRSLRHRHRRWCAGSTNRTR